MKRLAFLFLMLLAAPLWAELVIDGPRAVPAFYPAQLKIKDGPKGATYFWRVDGPDGKRLTGQMVRVSATHVIFTGAPGRYAVNVRAVWTKDKATGELDGDEIDLDVTVGNAPPVPPGPPDPPKPPGPPTPPTPAGPLRVLIVYESADLPKLPKEQQAILFDMKVRSALKDRTDKAGPDGRGFNIWDKDVDASGAAKFWQDALKRPRVSTPFIHLFKGDALIHEGPLPADAKGTLDLINKYAGG